jgi:putative membrane protein (TIGR04086 family)
MYKGVIILNKLKYFGINLVICCVMILLLLLVTSAIFAYTSINDKYLDIFVYSIVGISIFLTSVFLNRKIKSKGVIYGSIFGLLAIVTIYLIGAIFLSFSISYTAVIYIAIGIISGLIGGIIGVNL